MPDAPQRDVVSKGDGAAQGPAPGDEYAVESPTLRPDQNPRDPILEHGVFKILQKKH